MDTVGQFLHTAPVGFLEDAGSSQASTCNVLLPSPQMHFLIPAGTGLAQERLGFMASVVPFSE